MVDDAHQYIKIFYSYAHEDEKMREELEKHLSILKQQGVIQEWHDRNISAGTEWANEINEYLNTAQIILLLVSSDFMSSRYCYSVEMQHAMDLHNAGKALVIPIILRPIDWEGAPFDKLQILPSDAKPVTIWPNRDEAFLNVAKGIRKVVEQLKILPLAASTTVKRIDSFQPMQQQYDLTCPYRGLAAFKEDDAPFFFGRETFTGLLMECVRKKPLVAVLGPSGSGKSSLVFAGLLPYLHYQGTWQVASFRPADKPFRALAASLLPLLEPKMSETDRLLETTKLAEILQREDLQLYDVIERILEKLGVDHLLLFIDQFEEIYTFCKKEDRERFLDSLLSAIEDVSRQQKLTFTLIITLRADFLGQALLYRPFANALQHADLKLGSMTRQELHDTIEKPARQLNITIQEGLTERILDAVSREPGNLPLLEFTLTLLWARRSDGQLTHIAYEEIGGVEKALATYAEAIYTKLDEKKQLLMRRIFVQLVHPGEGTEDTRHLATRVQLGEECWELVTDLSDSRLIVSGRDEVTGEETAELVHEALIKGWGRFRPWIDENREFRLWQERIRIRLREWKRADCNRSELLRGSALAEADAWLVRQPEGLSYEEEDFIQRSHDQHEWEEKRDKFMQEMNIMFTAEKGLSGILDGVYQFVTQVADVSSMLITLYDKDLGKTYDVFAINNGTPVEALTIRPHIVSREERPIWWQAMKEMRLLCFSPIQEPYQADNYYELLTGTWGDQRQTESFLLLPMKTSNHVTGSLSLTSLHKNAYHPEEIQVLETMVQMVTVNIENAKFYEQDRQLLQEAKQREAQLAAINGALQTIGSGLSVTELLSNLVKSVAVLVNVEMCVFFQLSPTKEELITHTIYAPTFIRQVYDGSDRPALATNQNKSIPDELINMIRLPIKDTILEQRLDEGFFYLDTPQLEELAQKGGEAITIFLQETQILHILMIPMSYQGELIGILGVPTPKERCFFRPKDIGSLLAISAQATSAIRNAQLFEQREEAYAEIQHLSKLKDEFLITASHELRTPLSAISGYSSLLRRQSSHISPPQILRFATKIAGATEQLINLVSSMTEAAQMGAEDKKLDLQIEPVHVLSAVEIASTILTMNAEQKISYNIDQNFWVGADIMRFRQVLSNLLENAVKYSPPESHVYLSSTSILRSEAVKLLSDDQFDLTMLESEDHPVVLIRVQDQGEGISPEDQQRIFEKFVRTSRSLATSVRGSGLGLYICRRYIEAMGGKVWIERSVLNEGSTFSFYLLRVDPPIVSLGLEN